MVASAAVTRLAPSPTGALHLGNARTFCANWALARQRGWRIVMRIEDLDGPRVKDGADREALEDLKWLGLDWDEGPLWQRSDLAPYREALDRLRRKGLTYPCTCTRRQIVSALSAPHADEHELRYPGTCRPPASGDCPPPAAADAPAAQRLLVPDEVVHFTDQVLGDHAVNVQQQVGDFVVGTKVGLPSYQLAVVVDDARQGVTDVVRGDDLLSSTARQRWLYRLLDLTAPPRTWHLPLVVGPDGHRLAKRHGDTRVRLYRQAGVDPRRVLGLIGFWCGLLDRPRPIEAGRLRDQLCLERMPRQSVTFQPEDHAWLIED